MTAATMARPRAAVRRDHTAEVHLPATGALTLLTVVTAIGMCRVFPDWAYLRPMLAVAIGVHAVMCTLRMLRTPAWLALPVGLAALAVLMGLIYFRDTTRLGFPTGDTIDQFRVSVRLVWQQFPRAVSPVPSEGSFAVAAATGLGLCAWLADSFAFRAFGRAEAVVPAGVLFVFTSALGVDRNRIATAALWIGAAIFTIAALRLAHSRDDSAWMGKRRQSLWSALPAAVTCALFATTGAAALGPNLPGAGNKALLDTRNRTPDITEVVSPLVDIRSTIVNRGNVELFTVATDKPSYLALTALARFDGRRWNAVLEDTRPAIGTLSSPPQAGESNTATITIKRLKGQYAPAAPTAISATWAGDQGMLWADEAGALFVDGGLKPNYQYQITSESIDPSADELRSATVANPPSEMYTQLPKLPSSVAKLADQITAGAATPYDKARLLQDYFTTYFDYSTTVQRGHSNDAMINFLQIRKGYCEQFAGTFAAMARYVGLPTRVMVGFTYGKKGPDGTYHVAGRNAHAWDEVWFDGYGWLLFDPTPGHGAPGAENHTGEQPFSDDNVSPGGTTGAGERPTPTTVYSPPVDPRRNPDHDQRPTTPPPAPNVIIQTDNHNGAPGVLIFLGAVLLLFGWVTLMPKVVTRWTRRRLKTPDDRVASAWASTVRSLTLAGEPRLAGSTPLEYARAVDYGRAEAIEIARLVTRAVYSPRGVDKAAADRSEILRDEVDAVCRTRMSLLSRVMAHFDPRAVAGRITG
jgi:transglutaminase-like putative cysteine protease